MHLRLRSREMRTHYHLSDGFEIMEPSRYFYFKFRKKSRTNCSIIFSFVVILDVTWPIFKFKQTPKILIRVISWVLYNYMQLLPRLKLYLRCYHNSGWTTRCQFPTIFFKTEKVPKYIFRALCSRLPVQGFDYDDVFCEF